MPSVGPLPVVAARDDGYGGGGRCISPSRLFLNRMQTREFEAGALVPAHTDVHRLDGLAGGALHEVVQRGHDDHATRVLIALEPDIAPVRAAEELRFRVTMDAGILLDEAHEGLILVCLAVDLAERLVVEVLVEEDMRCGEDAPDRLDRGRRETHVRRVGKERP